MLPPHFNSSSTTALARAVAVQQAAIAVVWMDLAHPLLARRHSIVAAGGSLVVVTVTVALALVLAPVAARASSRPSACGRCVVLGAVGGALASLAAAPFAYAETTPSPGVTQVYAAIGDLVAGSFAGAFAGLAASVLVVYRLRMPEDVLDRTARLYAAAGASMIPSAVLLVLLRWSIGAAPMGGALFVVGGFGLMGLARVSQRRRLAWLDRVRAGREPGYSIEARADPINDLPAFAGSGEGAHGVLMQATSEPGGHPFRADPRMVPIARVHIEGKDASQAAEAIGGAVAWGALGGLAVMLALLVPLGLAMVAIGG